MPLVETDDSPLDRFFGALAAVDFENALYWKLKRAA